MPKFLVGLALTCGVGIALIPSGSASAAPQIFFGEDTNANSSLPTPNSDAARNSFFNNLTGVGTETFDGLAAGTSNPSIAFPGAGTATISGGGQVTSIAGNGRFPISSPNYYEASSANFTLNFSNPVAAFGFYGTDIGDFGGSLSLLLTPTVGASFLLPVGNSFGIEGTALYFGFIDTVATYSSVQFINSNFNDVFGFDNFSIGSPQQVQLVVPGPVAGAGLVPLLGIAGAWLVRRRKRKVAA